MDMKHEPDYKFINLDGLDENIKSEIKAILKSKIASNVLKLPWDCGEKDYNSNSVMTNISEVPVQWQRYSEDIATYEIPDRTTSMITSPISRAVPYAPSFMPVQYQEWQPSNTCLNNASAKPNSYQQFISYGTSIYQSQAGEILTTASTIREPDRCRSSNRSRKNESDSTSIVNSTEIHPNYVMQRGQFNQMQAICHPNMSYVTFQVQAQPHPATGQPILIPSHHYPRPSIHLNNHPHYSLLNFAPTHQQSSHTFKHLRQPNQHISTFGTTKRNQPIQKCEKETPDPPQSFPQFSKNDESDFPSDRSLIVNNDRVNGLVTTNQETECKKMKEIGAEEKKVEKSESVRKSRVSQSMEIFNDEKGGVLQKKSKNDRQIELKNINEHSAELEVIEERSLGRNCVAISNEDVDPTIGLASPTSLMAKSTCISFANVVKKGSTEQTFALNGCHSVYPVITEAEDIEVTRNEMHHGHQRELCKHQSGLTLGDDLSFQKIVEGLSVGRKKTNSIVQKTVFDPNTYRMGEFLLNYHIEKQTVSLLPRGLTNRGNYCYINSILQALLACPPFYNLLKAMPRCRHAPKNSPTPLIDSMVQFVNEYSPLSPGARLPRKDLRAQRRGEDTAVDIQGGSTFEPSYVYTMLKNTSYPGVFSIDGRQEDAEEFLSCLLNGISDEMLALMKKVSDVPDTPMIEESNVNYNSGDEEWKVMGPRNKGSITRSTEFGRTPLSDIFRGQLRSRISRQGEQSTDNVQPFFTLQLDIEKAESVEAALEILVGKDQVEGMTCSKTKQQIQAWKQVTLEELPVILILHLKWFDYKLDGCSKICKSVSYAIDLKVDGKFLSTNVSKKLTAKQKQYKLFAVTYHDGKEATKGHYVTDAFHVSFGAWVRYDDSSVKGISEYDVLNPSPPRVPYLLYYRRCDTIGNNLPNSHRPR